MVCSQPLAIQADSEPPWAPSSCPRFSHPSVVPVTEGPFAGSGVVGLSSTLADSRPIPFVLAEPQALMRASYIAWIG